MAHYMIQFAYTAEAHKALTKNPVNRFDALRELAGKFGGKVLHAFYCFGEYDGVILLEAPDNRSASAIALTAISAGHLKSFMTTVLLTAEETMEAMRLAGAQSYPAPR
jgi:uncharacterized protein with GYD domain